VDKSLIIERGLSDVAFSCDLQFMGNWKTVRRLETKAESSDLKLLFGKEILDTTFR
jgi:hypothetical protein